MDNLGQAYRQGGDLTRAIEIGEAAVKKAPEAAVLWHNLGESYRDAGDIDAAIRCLKKARRIAGEPMHFAVLANTLAVGKHDWEAALTELQIAMGVHSNVAPLHAEYARALVIGFSQLVQKNRAILPSWVSMLNEASRHIERATVLGHPANEIRGIKDALNGLLDIVNKRK